MATTRAARLKPSLLAPQLALLVANWTSEIVHDDDDRSAYMKETFTIAKERLEGIFGERTREALELLASATTDEPYVKQIAEQAKELLNAPPSS